jgi:hypothetical protein
MRIASLLLAALWPLLLGPVALAGNGIPPERHQARPKKPFIKHHRRMPSEGDLGRPRRHYVSPERIPFRNSRHV